MGYTAVSDRLVSDPLDLATWNQSEFNTVICYLAKFNRKVDKKDYTKCNLGSIYFIQQNFANNNNL